jgi:hypothetical protein
MAVANPTRAQPGFDPRVLEWSGRFAEVIGALWSTPSVKKVLFTLEPRQLDLWIVMEQDNPDDAERIYLMERDFLAASDLLVMEFHVVSLDHVAEEHLPEGRVLFERPG